MRKITFLLLLIVIGSLYFAQTTAGDYPKPSKPIKPQKITISVNSGPNIQSGPTIIPITAKIVTHQEYIMGEINAYRHSLGLSSVQMNDVICNFAKVRAQEISVDFSHKGYEDRVANHTLPYTYSISTENLAKTNDYTRVVTLWKNSPGHAENMRKDTPFVCVEEVGDYYAYEGMKP